MEVETWKRGEWHKKSHEGEHRGVKCVADAASGGPGYCWTPDGLGAGGARMTSSRVNLEDVSTPVLY